MNIIPFRPRLSLSRRKPTRRPPLEVDPPDRWNPPGWNFVCTLSIVVSFVIALVLAYRDVGRYLPDWMPRPDMRGFARFDLALDGREARGRVVDGDTLALQHVRIRLDGIDAPEMGQPCRFDDREIDCGSRASRSLQDFVAGGRVFCSSRGTDRYGRTLAICVRADNRDLGRHQVANGWAFADRKYPAYLQDEAAARRDRLGIWAGTIISPRSWRSGQR